MGRVEHIHACVHSYHLYVFELSGSLGTAAAARVCEEAVAAHCMNNNGASCHVYAYFTTQRLERKKRKHGQGNLRIRCHKCVVVCWHALGQSSCRRPGDPSQWFMCYVHTYAIILITNYIRSGLQGLLQRGLRQRL